MPKTNRKTGTRKIKQDAHKPLPAISTCPSQLPDYSTVGDVVESIRLDLVDILRDYQLDCVLFCMKILRKEVEWIVGELPTGAGKSWICVAIAAACRRLTYFYTKKVVRSMVLCPSGELSEQNWEKMESSGLRSGIVSASLDRFEVDKDVVVGTFISVANKLDQILEHGPIGSLIIDEAHEDFKVTHEIVAKLRKHHPNLRVIGLTATPYSKANGYIYEVNRYDEWPPWDANYTRNPRYKVLFFRITADRLIEKGFLIPGLVGVVDEEYDTDKLKMVNGQWTDASVTAVFGDDEDARTKAVVKDFKTKLKGHKSILIYCHNRALMRKTASLLPKKQSAYIDSETPKEERADIIARFKKGKLKYLVNVLTLKRGFDAPRVTAIVLMMASESPALVTQILGRGTRLCPEINKKYFSILDYGRNIRRLFPDGNIYNPIVRVGRQHVAGPVSSVTAICPTCASENQFKALPLPEGVSLNLHGFMIDDSTQQTVLDDSGLPIPGHHGIQCTHYHRANEDAPPQRCSYLWSENFCCYCSEPLSAHADSCSACGQEQKELELDTVSDFLAKSQYAPKVGHVHSFRIQKTRTRKGKEMVLMKLSIQEPAFKALNEEGQVEVYTPAIQFIRLWLAPNASNERAQSQWDDFCDFVFAQRFQTIDDAVRAPILNRPGAIEFMALPPPDPESSMVFYEIRAYRLEPLFDAPKAQNQPVAQIGLFDTLAPSSGSTGANP